jgi:sulfur-carrier protein adenylyltransferase/sulfurtransferase
MLKSVQELSAEVKKSVTEVETASVHSDIAAGKPPYLLLDVREPGEVAQGALPGAVPIPRGMLEVQITRVTQDPAQPIVCYCGGGTRSLFAAEQLQRMGFSDVKSMAGGFRAWTQAGYPVTPPGA